MVFTPFSLQLRHAKTKGTSGQDLRIQAPEISATLSSREFLGFVDVVRHACCTPCALVSRHTPRANCIAHSCEAQA